jgi:hypothetical protein
MARTPATSDQITPEAVTPITVNDTKLTEQQTAAVMLEATGEYTHEQIAEQTGYSGRTAVQRFLSSDRGKEGVQIALEQRILSNQNIALNTILALATGARSEKIRLEAAIALRDEGRRLRGEEGASRGRGGSVNVQINLAQPGKEQGETIELSPVDAGGEGGVGEKPPPETE